MLFMSQMPVMAKTLGILTYPYQFVSIWVRKGRRQQRNEASYYEFLQNIVLGLKIEILLFKIYLLYNFGIVLTRLDKYML